MPKEPPIDELNNTLKEIVYRRKNAKVLKKLAKSTNFDYQEVEALALIKQKINRKMGPISRIPFRDILHSGLDYTENLPHLLVDRVFSAIDKKDLSSLTVDQWIEGFSIMLKGSLDERIEFAYKVYDLMKTDSLKKEQIFPMMRGCLIMPKPDEDPDEMVKDLLDMMLKKLDVDRNGRVSQMEFTEIVKKNVLFLECMGPIFPSRQAQHAFLTTFSHRKHRF
ncbi:EF-hand calcium-binding domain-containing protein 1-like [Leptopilina heterotoma]|uniref:EF-hand calcium-binding domain-containing protein 1-like n=1 Tax=Leptopilina heterotoma TaxID=63436 RepID=UPI001CA83D56|nr:EF-hand calcium-binding domain-containing protein 1-like [Leptopilina heterotoma]